VTRSTKTKTARVTAGAAALVILPACGSQPAVCEKEDALSSAVNKLGSAITSANPSQIQSAGQEVQTDANALVTSAQNTYPGQTAEVKSSVQSLTQDINNFANSSDKTTAAIGLVASLSQVKSAFQGLKTKYQGSCG
jgi:phage host-nuclease inhibitor protein Gam